MKSEKYVVVSIKNMYAGSILSSSPISFVLDRGEEIEKVSVPAQATSYELEDAKAKVEELEDETYICGHNEAGRPEYLVVSEDDAECIFTMGSENNYKWEDCRCESGKDGTPCGECSQCFEFMIDADADRYREAAK